MVKSHSVLEVTREIAKQFPFLMDVCGVDWPERAERFDVVYHFANPEEKRRLRVKAHVADGGAVPSVTSVYKGANWFEREAFDLFGVRFDGHPNLRRILCHEDFVGHPLRKDYPGRSQPGADDAAGAHLRQGQGAHGQRRRRITSPTGSGSTSAPRTRRRTGRSG